MKKLFRLWILLTAVLTFAVSAGEIEMRRAFRRELEENPRQAVRKYLKHSDPVIRNRAIYELYIRDGRKALPVLAKYASEKNESVARMLLNCGMDARRQYQSDLLLQALADQSVVPEIRRKANRLTTFNFHRNTMRLKDNPGNDHEIVRVGTVPLPEKGWKFFPDRTGDAHRRKVFAPGFRDIGWSDIGIGNWEAQGYPGYDGIGWYRVKFRMPARPDCKAVELYFQGVDESAWVWLNGVYVGQHDIGTAGWDKQFWIDVTREIRWNAENQLTVRVEDTAMAGGIWRPVYVEILK